MGVSFKLETVWLTDSDWLSDNDLVIMSQNRASIGWSGIVWIFTRKERSLDFNESNPHLLMTFWFGGAIWHHETLSALVNTLRPRQDGRHFPDDTFERIFLKENVIILIKISLKFVPNGPINNIPALGHIMAWRRPGDKPLSEPMMVRLPTHICVTRPQWVEVMACCLRQTNHYLDQWWLLVNQNLRNTFQWNFALN